MKISRCGCRKVGHGQRCFRLYALFGGKKDNSGKSDDAPSKVSFSHAVNVVYTPRITFSFVSIFLLGFLLLFTCKIIVNEHNYALSNIYLT